MPHNIRAPQMWEIIKPHVDEWGGKIVLDLGCGYGDMCVNVATEGAFAVGVDLDISQASLARANSNCASYISLHEGDVVDYARVNKRIGFCDIVLCFSVIPYLGERYGDLLESMYWMSSVAFLEIQCKGDGPGTMDKWDIHKELLKVWEYAKPIGHTVVNERNKKRLIWKCWDV